MASTIHENVNHQLFLPTLLSNGPKFDYTNKVHENLWGKLVNNELPISRQGFIEPPIEENMNHLTLDEKCQLLKQKYESLSKNLV